MSKQAEVSVVAQVAGTIVVALVAIVVVVIVVGRFMSPTSPEYQSAASNDNDSSLTIASGSIPAPSQNRPSSSVGQRGQGYTPPVHIPVAQEEFFDVPQEQDGAFSFGATPVAPPQEIQPVAPLDPPVVIPDPAEVTRREDMELRAQLFSSAIHIDSQLNASNFSGNSAMQDLATFGNNALKENLRRAADNYNRASAFDKPAARAAREAVQARIGEAQAWLAPRAYFGDWTYSTSNVTEPVGGQSSFTMRISVLFRCSQFRSLSFEETAIMVPQGLTVTNVTVSGQSINISIRGNVNSIRELVENRDNYRVRVFFTNLRSGANPPVPNTTWGATTPSADLLGIMIRPR